MSTVSQNKIITAAMIAIGNELLSGRTRDKNIYYLAQELTKADIDLQEVRIIADQREAIIKAVNDVRSVYDYVFTSGGIGPTHDDITAISVSAALGRPCIVDKHADQLLSNHYHAHHLPYTSARRLMARMPEGSQLINNTISIAPGFHCENIFVMAGVPEVFANMLDSIIPELKKSPPMHSYTIECFLTESTISEALQNIQDTYPQTSIGSYPSASKVNLVIRSRDKDACQNAAYAIAQMIARLQNNK